MNIAYNCDCLDYMKSIPDNYFDLCVADPPYGDGLAETNGEALTHTHTHTHKRRSEMEQIWWAV